MNTINTVGTVSTEEGWEAANLANCDIVELRYDLFKPSLEQMKVCTKPIILTYRPDSDSSLSCRVNAVRKLLPYVRYIDVEIDTIKTPVVRSLIEDAKDNAVKIIASQHWFKRAPDVGTCKAVERIAKDAAADILKLAFSTVTWEDMRNLSSILKALEMPNIVLGMDAFGLESRMEYRRWSSYGMWYGYIDRPVAPGQPSVDELASLVV